jgi:hypothetical protein
MQQYTSLLGSYVVLQKDKPLYTRFAFLITLKAYI